VSVLVAQGSYFPALIVFGAAALSDAVDGPVARARNQASDRGGWLDPFADKVLVVGVLAALAIRGLVPPWALLAVAAREVAALGLRARSPRSLPATADGKTKTVLQALAIAATLLAAGAGSDEIAAVAAALLIAAVALTLVSGVRLMHRAFQTAPDAR